MSCLFLILSWIFSGFFLFLFFKNSEEGLSSTPATIYDLTYLIVFFVFFVLPFISRIKLGQLIELERKLKETREDIAYFKNDTRQMVAALSSASATVNISHSGTSEEQEIKPEEKPKIVDESKERPKTAMELKILNTLWRRQALRFPGLLGYWTFRLNAVAPEFLDFREAGSRLIGEGLISETDSGQFLITTKGLRYCAENFNNFPPDMWYEDVPIPEGNFEKLLNKVKEL